MILRSKMFIVAGNIDDSIKSQTSSYDITIFKTFVDFEKYANEVPIILDTLIISARELPFNGTNMSRLLNVLNSTFVQVQGNVVYLVDNSTNIDNVNDFLTIRKIKNWAVYQGDLSMKFITDIVTGAGRTQAEGQNEIITYRIRATDYIKQQNQLKYESDDNKYYTDEDLLSGIPDEKEPEDIKPAQELETIVNYVVGDNSVERTLMVFFLAQYLALNEKVVIMERDVEYHTLTELATKSELPAEMIYIDELLDDIDRVIVRIKASMERLIIIGCKNRRNYDYNFLMDVLISNLKGDIPHIIRECDLNEIPYGKLYTIVVRNTVPDILKCCNSLHDKIEAEKVTFVGMQTCKLGPVNVNSAEMKSIIEVVLSINGIATQVVHANGIVLSGEEVVYDVLSIINRGNRG